MHTDLNTDQGRILLPIARSAIARLLGKTVAANEEGTWLRERGACFVTLTQNGQLRGCIGTLEAHRPLLQDVKANAEAAAFQDPRFTPLQPAELDTTEVEVSLLSAMQDMNFGSESEALAQLRPEVDGIVFEYGRYRSTFLPQVWEQLADPAEFMAHLKHKAGLSPSFWAKEVKLSRYTVSKWRERDMEATAK